MFCDGCGQQVQAGQQCCGACGKRVSPSAALYVSTPQSRLLRHLHLLGILWLVVAAFSLLGSAILGILATTIFGLVRPHDSANFPGGGIFLHALLTMLSVLVFCKAIAAIAAGFGLLKHLRWARLLAVVLACFEMLSFPFGTALGIYTLWVLMSPTSEAEYRQMSLTQ